MNTTTYDYGMIGLGTMGRNLALNMSDKGNSVMGYDKNEAQVKTFIKEAGSRAMFASTSLNEFLLTLKIPRAIILLVPAGKITDDVINELKPLLSENDLIMDFGNSHFNDTDKRIEQLATSKIHFMGVGISGGESGARYGPSIMPGGPKDIYRNISAMLQSVSAKVNDEPCVTWLGPGSAGHYVKMVHNGIEYGLMQLIAEAYHILKTAGNLSNDELHKVFSEWNKGKLQSFLIEITADIFLQQDQLTKNALVDMILDAAKQKGTGGWASEDAINLQVPIPVIDIAVNMRNLSAYKSEREMAQQILQGPTNTGNIAKNELIKMVEEALYFSIITTYAQGMALLQTASKKYQYDLQLASIAKIWRGGCIIRAALLENIHTAYVKQPGLINLMLDEELCAKLNNNQKQIRAVINLAVNNGIPVPALMMSLAYYDSYRSGWLPANLIQAQRDFFGAHTYERNDREGIFHTQWNQTNL
ncbi:MAG TPA: NADP-dependent phosphogluconate dehydrogenase [Ferruginibacter sp.]|nr:NADP-dependent phosphogluconate dehydrogenase [Ferruginibacter sp.]